MWHEKVVDAKFIEELETEDARVVARVQASGCPRCGGRLDRADYPRKPRGGSLAPAGDRIARRLSLCCAREGCRRRATPPSLVFLGRRVYLGIAVLAATLRSTLTPGEAVPAPPPRRTVGRWGRWFQSELPATSFFVMARARLWPPLEGGEPLPAALVERFTGDGRGLFPPGMSALIATLRFLAPLTTASVSESARFLRAEP